MMDKKYIYESLDGGKTIYRREFGDYDNREKIRGELEVSDNYWEMSTPENIEIVYSFSEKDWYL